MKDNGYTDDAELCKYNSREWRIIAKVVIIEKTGWSKMLLSKDLTHLSYIVLQLNNTIKPSRFPDWKKEQE